jgi:hypothetical protein
MAATDFGLARQRLERVMEGATLQDAYSAQAYEPIGDKLRADLRAVLEELDRRHG